MTKNRLAQFKGFDGYWLKTATCEAFVSIHPYPRVVAFREKGGKSILRPPHKNGFFGIRSWFLEPIQTDDSPLPALQAAKANKVTENHLVLTAKAEKKTGLQLSMEISLDDKRPVMQIRHGFKNLKKKTRKLAAWGLTVLPHGGVGVIPWRSQERDVRQLLMWHYTDGADPAIIVGQNALGVDCRIKPHTSPLKVGTHTNEGWVAALFDHMAIKCSSPYEPGAEYPESGANITAYRTPAQMRYAFFEIEVVGPLCDVAPGQTLYLDHTVELMPGVGIKGKEPDDWIKLVR